MLKKAFSESEVVFALIGAVGTELGKVREILEDRLKVIGYEVDHVRITADVIPKIVDPDQWKEGDEHGRITSLMNAGNEARRKSQDNSILALGAAGAIAEKRPKDVNDKKHRSRQAYIISSLKHPDEVERLRAIYPQGFYLVGVHSDEERRLEYLERDKQITKDQAEALMVRDKNEQETYGQKVTDTFHMSDFFVRIDHNGDNLKHSLWRFLGLLFGHPYVTPTFDEYSMFLAFSASLHSADLSRQVGAVIALDNQVVATGANDCPKAGGGHYWPSADKLPGEVTFPEDGRDFARGCDSNKVEQQRIIDDILERSKTLELDQEKVSKLLEESRIRDLTEYGRVVHAEMEALLSCARLRIPVKDGTLYSTTFPCHNCAKHIVAAGITRVVFIQPYQKSKALEFHKDSIELGFRESECAAKKEDGPKVYFEPFVGVGPRRFFDLFSLHLGSGGSLRRKDKQGKALNWEPKGGKLRLQMLPASYLDLEVLASSMFNDARNATEEVKDGK